MASVLQLAIIAQNANFRQRVNYLMMEKALTVAANNPDAADMVLIQKITDGREDASLWALAAVTNPTIAAGTHAEDGSTISDGDLKYQIFQQWTAFRI